MPGNLAGVERNVAVVLDEQGVDTAALECPSVSERSLAEVREFPVRLGSTGERREVNHPHHRLLAAEHVGAVHSAPPGERFPVMPPGIAA